MSQNMIRVPVAIATAILAALAGAASAVIELPAQG
jgi:hypothetical protein